MKFTREKYPGRIELVQKYLQQQAEKNEPCYFEIEVDGIKVVRKTNNIAEFENYFDYINGDTQELKIMVYSTSATSPNNKKHFYYFHEEKQPGQSLNGFDVEQRLTEKLNHERERWNAELKEKELTDTKQKLLEADQYIEKLEGQLSEFKSKKLHWGDVNLGELASVVVEGFVRRNPQLLAKIPGAESLAGIIVKDNEEKQLPLADDAQVSFSKKNTVNNTAQNGYIQLLEQLESCFSQAQLDTVMQILGALIQQPQHISTLAELLGINPKTFNNNET